MNNRINIIFLYLCFKFQLFIISMEKQYTINEVAVQTRVKSVSVYNWINSGELKTTKIMHGKQARHQVSASELNRLKRDYLKQDYLEQISLPYRLKIGDAVHFNRKVLNVLRVFDVKVENGWHNHELKVIAI